MDTYPRPPIRKMVGRGLARRCPLCGSGGLFRHWLEPRRSCPRCQLKLDRGEADFFLGAYTLNFIVVLLTLAAFLALAVALSWPDVWWSAALWVGASLMVAVPMAFYPVSRTLWLAIDLAMRPPTPMDFPEPGNVEKPGRVS
jgi:uncharacterized protein (DUF983 family)